MVSSPIPTDTLHRDHAFVRAELLEHQIRAFKTAGSTRADVILSEVNGQKVIFKDYQNSSKGFSLLLAPWLVYRECRALQQLDAVDGIPRFLGKIDCRAFAMEYLPTCSIREVAESLDWGKFIGEVETRVYELHHAGVVHGDLRNASNILVSDDQRPVFVDFVSAVRRGLKLNPFSRLLFDACIAIDLGAILKLKRKFAPELLNAEELGKLEHKGVLEKSVRWWSHRIRHSVQKLFP